ncbi:MAG TPA: condensation domain-containing protein, partial [Ktedonobacteraceae bacterium]
MSKKLLLKQRQDLEAVPFLDAHDALSWPLRSRYIVEACEAQQRMDRAQLNETLRTLFAFHDLLRAHVFEDQSIKKLFITPLIPEEPVQWVDLASSSETEQRNAIRETMNSVYDSLLREDGFLCQFLYFDLGERTHGLFVTVIHHILADGYSMYILSQDIQHVYLQLCARKPPRLIKTASFNAFAARLQKYLHQEFPSELDYWRSLRPAIKPFLVDYPENRLVDPLTGGT